MKSEEIRGTGTFIRQIFPRLLAVRVSSDTTEKEFFKAWPQEVEGNKKEKSPLLNRVGLKARLW